MPLQQSSNVDDFVAAVCLILETAVAEEQVYTQTYRLLSAWITVLSIAISSDRDGANERLASNAE